MIYNNYKEGQFSHIIKRDNLVIFYCICAFEIWSDKRGTTLLVVFVRWRTVIWVLFLYLWIFTCFSYIFFSCSLTFKYFLIIINSIIRHVCNISQYVTSVRFLLFYCNTYLLLENVSVKPTGILATTSIWQELVLR